MCCSTNLYKIDNTLDNLEHKKESICSYENQNTTTGSEHPNDHVGAASSFTVLIYKHIPIPSHPVTRTRYARHLIL